MSSVRNVCAVLIVLLVIPLRLSAQFNYDAYRPGTLQGLIDRNTASVTADTQPGRPSIAISGHSFPTRVRVIYLGQRRPLVAERRLLLAGWARGIRGDSSIADAYVNEYLFREGDREHWLAVQKVLEPSMAQELKAGDPVALYVAWFGAHHAGAEITWLFSVNEFEALGPGQADPMAPSQYELNGFLLGQHIRAIEHELGSPYQQRKSDDQWVSRIYIIDRPHEAYMVFEFTPDRPDHTVTVQVTGDSGTAMVPFLGLVLGSDTAMVRRHAGPPTSVRQETDPVLTLWQYADRNYSFEFTPAGRLYSIRIMGWDGFPRMPALPLAGLEPLVAALDSRDPGRLLAVIAPDIEVFRGDSVYTIEGAARRAVSDTTSTLWQQLLHGQGSLRAALADSFGLAQADPSIRVYEHPRPGATYTSYRFPSRSQLSELVFEGFAGQWRLWEVRFRQGRTP